MASNSGRRSGSSGRSSSRDRIVIGAEQTSHVRKANTRSQSEAEKKRASQRSSAERTGARVPRVPSASSRGSSAGRRVANQKRDDRDKRRQQIAHRRVLALALLVAALAGVAWGVMWLWNAPLFTVDTVDVTGEHHLGRADVLALAAIPPNATLLRLPKQEIAARVEASPWVASAEVSREFPHAIAIAVTERTAAALVDTGAGGQWLASADGHWLAKRTNEPTGTLVPVRDVPSLRPVPNHAVGSAELANALAVIAGISPQTRSKTKYVSAATVEKTVLVLNNDVQIFVGSSEDIAKKDLIARGILSTEKNVVYINVRATPPTVRGLNSTH
jgi:cell division protein FtsQ